MPIFSFVVPIYKTEPFLRQCIDSLLAQSFPDFEIVLVDDGSPDDCPKICDEYAKKFDKIRVIHKENGGLVSARKAGALAATGAYIVPVDSDDFLTETYLQAFADAVQSNHPDIVIGGFSSYFKERTSIPRLQVLPCGYYGKQEMQREIYGRMLSTDPFFTFGISPNACSKCIRREIVLQNQKNIPDGITMGEDASLSYACLLDAESIEIIPEVGYMYRQNENSMTHTYNPKLASQSLLLVEYMVNMAKEKNWNAEAQLCAYTYMIQSLLIHNETQTTGRGKYANLKLWIKNPCIQKIWRMQHKPKMSLIKRVENFALQSEMLWILSWIKTMRKVKWKMQRIK